LIHHRIQRHMCAASERVLTVAPNAAHRTAGQPHKRARSARMGRFTLD